MKLVLKIILGFFMTACLGIIALVVFFPKERIKTFVLEKAKSHIDLPIELDDIGFSVFPRFAFHLKGFSIGSDQHEVEASFEDFEIKARVSTLLGRDINMAHIRLKKPILKVYNANMDTSKEVSDDSDTIEIQASADEESSDFDFFISEMTIQDGEIWVFDQKNIPSLKIIDLDQKLSINFTDGHIIKAQGQTSVHEIWSKDLAWEGIELALTKDMTYDLKKQTLTIESSNLDIQDLSVAIDGVAQVTADESYDVNVKLKTEPTQLTSVFALVPSLKNQAWKTQGTFAVDGRIKGVFDMDDATTSWEKSDSSISITLDKGRLANASYGVTFDPVSMQTLITPSMVHIQKLFLKSTDSEVVATGKVSDYIRTPKMDLNLKANMALKEIEPWVDPQTLKDAEGNAQFNVTIQGPADLNALRINGDGAFKQAAFEMPGMQYKIKGLNGRVELNNTHTSFQNVSLMLGKSDIHITSAKMGGWKDLIDDKKPIAMQLTGKSKFIDYNDIMPDTQDASEPSSQEPLVLPDAFYRLKGSGVYAINDLDYQKTKFTNIDSSFTLDQGALDIQTLKLKTFGGSFKGDGMVDFRPKDQFPFDLNIGLENASVQKALSFATSIEKLVHLAPFLSADMSLNTKAKGHLTNMLSLGLDDLTSDGTFFLKDAQFKNHPLQKKLATFLSASEFKEFNLNEWAQKFSIKDGKVFVSDLKLKAKDFSFTIDGYQGLDGNQDFSIDAILPKRLESKISQVVPAQIWSLMTANSEGSFALPLSSKGTVNNPTLSLNSQILASNVKHAAKQKLTGEIEKQKEAVQDKVQDTVKDQLEKTLKDKVIPMPKPGDAKEKVEEKTKDEIKNIGKKLKKLF